MARSPPPITTTSSTIVSALSRLVAEVDASSSVGAHAGADQVVKVVRSASVVSKQLGHASVAITSDVYGHPDEKAAAEAAELAAQMLEGK